MLTQDFFETQSTQSIAENLLGCHLQYQTSQGIVSGYIVETEAYLGVIDKWAHVYGGRKTVRNQPLYKSGGTQYVYQSRAFYLLNFSCQPAGTPECVLIRAVEPDQGIAFMQTRRSQEKLTNLTSGPGKLCQAFGIDKALNDQMIGQTLLQIDQTDQRRAVQVATSPRIGTNAGGKWRQAPLRYTVVGNPYVSHTHVKEWNQTTKGWQL